MVVFKSLSPYHLVYPFSALPAAYLIYQFYFGLQWIDPIEEGLHAFGLWTLRFLLLSLAVTPVVRLVKKPQWIRFRKILGLMCVFYLSCHVLIYVVYDQALMWAALLEEITSRLYLILGLVASLGLWSMALTSNQASIVRFGMNWHRIHRMVYLWSPLAVLHFTLSMKADLREPLIYASLLILLLGLRLWWFLKRR